MDLQEPQTVTAERAHENTSHGDHRSSDHRSSGRVGVPPADSGVPPESSDLYRDADRAPEHPHVTAYRAAEQLVKNRRHHMALICAHTREVIALDAQIVALESQLTEPRRAAIRAEVDEQDESMLEVLTATAGHKGGELSRG